MFPAQYMEIDLHHWTYLLNFKTTGEIEMPVFRMKTEMCNLKESVIIPATDLTETLEAVRQ